MKISGFPGDASGKEPACQRRIHRGPGFDPCVGKIPWRKAWQPTPVLLPGESRGQRSLAAIVHRIAKSRIWVGHLACTHTLDFPGGSDGKASADNAGDPGSIPSSGSTPGEGNGNLLQCPCLENTMDGDAW